MTHESIRTRIARAGIASLAVASLLFGTATPAIADDATLEDLQVAAINAADDYQAALEDLEEIEAEMAENEAAIAEIEAQLPEQRAKSSAAIRATYKLQQSQSTLLDLILSADSFGDFITQLQYLNSITEANLEAIQELDALSSELETLQAELESEREQAAERTSEAESALAAANSTAEAARAKASEDAAANQAAYEAAQEAGEEDATVAEIEAATSGSSTDDAASSGSDSSNDTSSSGSDSTSSSTSGSGSSTSSSTGSTDSSSSDSSSSSSDSSSSSGTVTYTYVGASTYGDGDGLMYGTTASGDIVTPTSMGVAMKTMPLGTIIEITYNGRTVTAVVNDRGPYIAGREIDMQPAVASALGFSGVGTVGYRVVS